MKKKAAIFLFLCGIVSAAAIFLAEEPASFWTRQMNPVWFTVVIAAGSTIIFSLLGLAIGAADHVRLGRHPVVVLMFFGPFLIWAATMLGYELTQEAGVSPNLETAFGILGMMAFLYTGAFVFAWLNGSAGLVVGASTPSAGAIGGFTGSVGGGGFFGGGGSFGGGGGGGSW